MTSWCFYYRSIFTKQDNEQPPDEILDNDVSLDRWLEMQKHRKEHEGKLQHAGKGGEVFQILE